VVRRWLPFDRHTINRELLALPSEDYYRLTSAMLAYRKQQTSGFVVDNYGEGLMMVKDDSRGQGRCLFFTVREVDGEEVLTALLVYKKESEKADKAALRTARRRMKESS
jgi:phage-related protein